MISSSAFLENHFPHIKELCQQTDQQKGMNVPAGNVSSTEEILATARKVVQNRTSADELRLLDDLITTELRRLDHGLIRSIFKTKMPPHQLRAYAALTELDLAHLDRLCQQRGDGSRTARIPGLLSDCDTLHQLMEEAAYSSAAIAGSTSAEGAFAYETVCKLRGEISRVLGGKPVGSFSFSRKTFRAIQWILFLHDLQNFNLHVDVLQRTAGIFGEKLQSESRLARYRKYGFHLRYFPGSALFRMASREGALQLTVNEGFLRAPDSVLQAVVRSALRSSGKADKQSMGAYTSGEDYLQTSRRLLNQPAPGCPEQGLFHNLSDIYTNSVSEYLPGKSSIPLLRWMEKTSYRTYGVYQSSSDTIRISPALDHPDVPAYVLGYVLFHELAHARVGVRVHGGRHQIHSKRFYEVEKQYPMRRQAETFLRTLSQKMA